jgi:hypothetical protein
LALVTWVALKPICEHLGLDPASQRLKVQADLAFADRWRVIPLPWEEVEVWLIILLIVGPAWWFWLGTRR